MRATSGPPTLPRAMPRGKGESGARGISWRNPAGGGPRSGVARLLRGEEADQDPEQHRAGRTRIAAGERHDPLADHGALAGVDPDGALERRHGLRRGTRSLDGEEVAQAVEGASEIRRIGRHEDTVARRHADLTEWARGSHR